ncbi:hypothetical protein C8R44DRAFT_731891 [Mycena epipterygia]|nr:hypothetical protein C8R44DRAFT_731891 [Mycena epipterygia]
MYDERTVVPIFWKKRVLSNVLIPILLRATWKTNAPFRLISAMTWPIDMAEELAELDPTERADFTQLRQSHQHYKAAILQPRLWLLSLVSSPRWPRPRGSVLCVSIRSLLSSCTLGAFTASANVDADPLLASWNTLVLEIRGTQSIALLEQLKEEQETTFSLDAFEMKFATAEIVRAVAAAGAVRELEAEPRRVVSLLHRVAVRAKAEGLFFKVCPLTGGLYSTTNVRPGLHPLSLPDHSGRAEDVPAGLVTPRPRRTRDLRAAALLQGARGSVLGRRGVLPEEPGAVAGFLELRAAGEGRARAAREEARGGRGADQLGIVIAALVDAGQIEQVNWVNDVSARLSGDRQTPLTRATADPCDGGCDSGRRSRELEEAAKPDDAPSDDGDDEGVLAKRMAQKLETSSSEMREKMVDFGEPFSPAPGMVPYGSDEEASRNPQLKLLFRLTKFTLSWQKPDASELELFAGANIPPADLQRTLKFIDQFLATLISLGGKKASAKTRRTRRARAPSQDSDGEPSDGEANSSNDAPSKKRKKRKEQERPKQQEYKSVQFIEDSDEEYRDVDAFLEREKEMRRRRRRDQEAPEEGQAEGTAKRKKKSTSGGDSAPEDGGGAGSDADGRLWVASYQNPKNAEAGTSSPEALSRSSEMDEDIPDALSAAQPEAASSDESKETMGALGRRLKNRLVISDDED